MELKDYQIKVLEYLDSFFIELKKQKAIKEKYYKFQLSEGEEAVHPEQTDYCQQTWVKMKAMMPIHTTNYTVREDGLGRNIPNVCFKVPTGGGKTLLASYAIQRVNQDYFSRNNGFVLWIVPSETIYTQTSKHLRDREHPYRQMLDRASGGKTIIFEKNDRFSKQDVEDNLCIMLLMLQSSNRQNNEALKIFKDSGKFESFFPEVDDYHGNNALLNAVPNLETADLVDGEANVISGLSIKHSLSNVLKQLMPIVVIDEGHRATTQLALNTVNSFNPRFILELSATPRENSNVLISIGGNELKKEQMIKLPINVETTEESNWKHTLNKSHAKLIKLSKSSAKLQGENGKYIRPIMLIKAETAATNISHVDEIKKYLMDNLEVREEEIRIKLSEKDEIKDEDLFDKLCTVKYIITKDALKEGWDCSFAYVLAILANTRSHTALTQFIGRVLRQPYATETSRPELNQCYVYCNNSDVNDAVGGIKKGLEEEGMGDISDQINTGGSNADEVEKAVIKINQKFKDEKIFIPKLNVVEGKEVREFDYYQDILAEINWEKYTFKKTTNLLLDDKNILDSDIGQIDIEESGQMGFALKEKKQISEEITAKIEISLMASQLMDKVPNPWQATRIIRETVLELGKKFDETKIALNSVYIVEEIKRDCFQWALEESESLFKEKLDKGVIFLKLLAEPFLKLNWKVQELRNITIKSGESPTNLDRNIYQPQYKSLFNNYEYKVASYINKNEAVKWWHRLGVKGTEYSIQGWKRDRIYPDFLVKLEQDKDGVSKVHFIETKGEHLTGNTDTEYKQKVFNYINQYANKEIHPVGEMKFVKTKDNISFHMVFEDEWETDLKKLIVN